MSAFGFVQLHPVERHVLQVEAERDRVDVFAGAARQRDHPYGPRALRFVVADLPPLAELREVARHAGADHQRDLLQHGIGRGGCFGHLPGGPEDDAVVADDDLVARRHGVFERHGFGVVVVETAF